MRFTLDQIEVFVACADRGSFSSAGRVLGRSQSTVSATIANLEAEFGTQLFDRRTKNPTLTPAGHTLLVDARDFLDRALSLESHADSISLGNPDQLVLALDVPYHLFMAPLRDFAARYSHIDVSLRHPTHGDVPGLVLDSEADLGIAFTSRDYDRRLSFRRLGNLVLCHVAHRDHPLARQQPVSFSDLQAYRHLAHPKHARAIPTSEYLQSVQTWYAESYEAVVALLRSRLGWATVPRQLIVNELRSGELVDLRLTAYPHTDFLVGIDLLWNRTVAQGTALTWLRERFASEPVVDTFL